MRILILRARTFVKVEAARGLAFGNMRAVAKAERSRDLNEQQTKRLRDALEKYKAKVSGGERALAALMGANQGGFNKFMSGKQGASWGMAFRAAAMMGLSVEELFGMTKADLSFPSIDDPLALEAARLALLDGVPRAQIEARYQQQKSTRGLKEIRLDDWYQALLGELHPDKLAKAEPDPKKPRQKKT